MTKKISILAKKIPIKFIPLFVGYLVFLFAEFGGYITFFKQYSDIMTDIGYVSLILYTTLEFFKRKEKIKNLQVWVVLLVASVALYSISKNFVFCRLLIFMGLVYAIGFNEVLKIDIYSKIIVFVFLFIAPIFGFSKMCTVLRADMSVRYCFGFGHPNIMSNILFSIMVEFAFLLEGRITNKKQRLLVLIVFITEILFCVFVTNSRAVAALLVILLAYILNGKRVGRVLKNKKVQLAIKVSFPVFTMLLLACTIAFSMKLPGTSYLNDLSSKRLYHNSYFLDKYGISILGAHIPENAENGHYLDTMYMRILLGQGLLIFMAFSYVYYKTFDKAIKDKNNMVVICLLLLMISGLVETNLPVVPLNIFTLYGSSALFNIKIKK